MNNLHPDGAPAQDRRRYHMARPEPPRLFLQLNAAISRAHLERDDRLVDLLLAAKMGAVRRHHELLAEGR